MNVSPIFLALPLSLAVGLAVAWVMPLIPDPPCQPSLWRRGGLFLLAGGGAWLALANSNSLGPLYSSLFPLSLPLPLALSVVAIALAGLYATTGSDLFYDRVVSRAVVWYPTLAILIIYGLTIPLFGLVGWGLFATALAGTLAGWLLGVAMTLPARWLGQHLRGGPPEPAPQEPLSGRCLVCGKPAHRASFEQSAQEPTEDFGEGDVWVLRLLGALLGPVGLVFTLVVAAIINGLFAIPVLARDQLSHRKAGSTYLPFVPALCVATVYVLSVRPS